MVNGEVSMSVFSLLFLTSTSDFSRIFILSHNICEKQVMCHRWVHDNGAPGWKSG